MARARNPNRDKAFEIYKEHNGEITNRKIAEMLDVPEKTISGWKSKSKDNWVSKLNGVLQSNERSTPNKNERRERGAPIGNTNAKGNKGNVNASPPKQNTNAQKHGFYSRMIPDDMQDIFAELDEHFSMLDMLWDNIKIQYMAIMRAQRIMFVEGKEEMVKEQKKAKYDWIKKGTGKDAAFEQVIVEEEFDFQFAWERQAQLLTVQSRAIGELRSSIEKFMELSDKTDERRLKLKKMTADIDKTHAMTDKIRSDMVKDDLAPIEITIKGVGEE